MPFSPGIVLTNRPVTSSLIRSAPEVRNWTTRYGPNRSATKPGIPSDSEKKTLRAVVSPVIGSRRAQASSIRRRYQSSSTALASVHSISLTRILDVGLNCP